jgi:hypothetical protein
MPSFLVCLEVHPLPESPPTGLDRVVIGYEAGGQGSPVWPFWSLLENGKGHYVAWSELPVLPAPGDRLTTDVLTRILAAAMYTNTQASLDDIARLRATLEVKHE